MILIFFVISIFIPVVYFYYFCELAKSFTIEKKGLIILAYSIAVILTCSSCITRINPGSVGVVVNLLGAKKGVEDKEIGIGIHFLLPWQQVYKFPIFEQNHEWIGEEGYNFQTIEGLSVHADIGINYHLSPDKVHDLFWRYRRKMEEITHLFIRNNIRDSINKISSKMRIEELYGDKKEDFFMAVQARVQEELNPLGFNISHLYIVGQFTVPPMVIEALNRKIEATQKAQQRENELREAEAEARKEIAKADGEAKSRLLRARAEADAIFMNAKAKADSNKLLTQSLSSELIRWETINKWDGALPRITGKDGMMIQLPMGDKE